MKSPLTAAVDVSATEGRVVLGWLEDERLSSVEVHRFPVGYSKLSDHCYWEVGVIFREIVEGLRKARAAFPDLASCGVSFWGCDHVLLDREGALLQPAFSYRDARTARIVEQLSAADRERLYGWTGIPVVPYNTTFQLAESLHAQPGLRNQVDRCLFLAEYVNLLLTGKAVNELSVASSGQLVQLHGTGYSPEALEFFQIPERWFTGPSLAGQTLGSITGNGDLDGLPVILVPAHATSCAFEAMPSFGANPLHLAGTTWVLAGFRSSKPYARADGCYLGISNERCGDGSYRPTRILHGMWMIDRLLEAFDQGPWDAGASFEHLLPSVGALPKSRHVLRTFDPLLVDPGDMRRAIDEHLRAQRRKPPETLPEYLRLLVDSLAHSVAGSARIFRHAAERPFDHVVAGGAAAGRPLICEGIANATGKRVVALQLAAAAAGSIGYQLKALGVLESLDDFRRILARGARTVVYEPADGSVPDFEL